MAIDAVIFDIGDVLEVNPDTGWRERWAARLNITDQFERRLDASWAAGAVGARALDQIERETALALALDEAALKELMEDAWREYVGTLKEELADYFARLRTTYKTGILSNSFVGAREREQEAHRLGDICDVIVYSHEVGCLKPDPRIYRIACARLDVAPELAVLLDHVQANARGARAIGMNATVFRNNAQAMCELQRLLTS